MKQTNKLLNISNIINYIFCLMIGFFVVNPFEQYGLMLATIVTSITGIANFIVGIINIVNKNKKIGICNIIIAIMFIFDVISFNKVDDFEEWIYILVVVCAIIPIILIILNLIFNRKTQDLKKSKLKNIIFLLGVIIEVTIVIIPVVVNRINLNNIEKVISKLQNDSSERIVIDNNGGTVFYDLEGNVINNTNYTLKDTYDFEFSDKTREKNSEDVIYLIMVEVDNQIWLTDYNGNLIERLYSIFGDTTQFSDFYKTIKDKIKRKRVNYNSNIGRNICLTVHQDNIYKFGSIENNGYQIIVELNKNELETDTELYKKIEATYKNDAYYNHASFEEIRNLYKYKKSYSIIKRNGETKKIDCNNMIFALNENEELVIKLYANSYIPYYDKDSAGFINLNGEKNSFNKKYLIDNTFDKYAIIYDPANSKYYLYLFNSKKIIDLKVSNYEIKYYDDKYFVCYNQFLILKDNGVVNLISSDDTLLEDEYLFINYNKENKKYPSPYLNIDIFNEENDEIIEQNLIYNY